MERSGRKVIDSAGRRVDEWRAARGGKIDDLARNPGYFPTTPEGYKFGTTARGLALLAGLITITEQRQGAINHAIHVALPQTRRSVCSHPAQRTDGEESDPNAIPGSDVPSSGKRQSRSNRYGSLCPDGSQRRSELRNGRWRHGWRRVLYAEKPAVEPSGSPLFWGRRHRAMRKGTR